MIFRVTRSFRFGGRVVIPEQTISVSDLIQAGRLRSMGLIGMVDPERTVKPPAERPTPAEPERAVTPPTERRAPKPRSRKKKVKDETFTDSGAGD